jgi:hypothetical protein
MIRIRLYREGGRYMESANNNNNRIKKKKGEKNTKKEKEKKKKKKKRKKKKQKKKRRHMYNSRWTTIDSRGTRFQKSLGLQESIEVITKHSSEGIHRWPLWLQDGHGRLLRLLLRHPYLHSILSADSRYSTLQALSSAGWLGPLLPALSWP